MDAKFSTKSYRMQAVPCTAHGAAEQLFGSVGNSMNPRGNFVPAPLFTDAQPLII
jgi:hypothetical protein